MKNLLHNIFIKLSFFNIISSSLYFKLIKIKFLKPILFRLIWYKLTNDMNNFDSIGDKFTYKKIESIKKDYWLSKQSLLWHLWSKENITDKRKKLLENFEQTLHFFPKNLNYFETGCGYPLYLHSIKLQDKIKNYYGYDPNEYLPTFFSNKNIFTTYPSDEKAEVILIMGGVLKYLYKKELEKFVKVILKLKSKLIIVSHTLDTKILIEKINIDQISTDSLNIKKIDEILTGDKTYIINLN